MQTTDQIDLSHIFNPQNRESVIGECLQIASAWLPDECRNSLRACWNSTKDLYTGKFPGYGACNTDYHDFAHTCDVLGATVRMCDGAISQTIGLEDSLLVDVSIAAMLHDSGYIQRSDDTTGTGAKYTKTHVARSIAFVKENRKAFDLDEGRADRIGRLIAGTDLATKFETIPFTDNNELFAGKLLASADLLGQMADRTYLEKLLFLYYEFKEAGFPGYDTEFDMLRKTMGFYEMTKLRLFGLLGEVTNLAFFHFSSRYGVQKNLYIESIERQIDYLRSIIDDDTVNFRKKLKRIDLEALSASHRVMA